MNFANEGGENTPLAAQLLVTSNDCAGGTAALDVEWGSHPYRGYGDGARGGDANARN